MDKDSYTLCEKLVPKSYVQQGQNAKSIHQNQIRHLLEQVSKIIITVMIYFISSLIKYL